jgi:hypothetical protein
MPVRQTRVFVRSDEAADWAETLIGRVFRPLVSEFEDALSWFWFSRYGDSDSGDCDISVVPDEYKRPLDSSGVLFHRSMRLRFNIGDSRACSAFEKKAKELIDASGYRISETTTTSPILEGTDSSASKVVSLRGQNSVQS